MLSSSGPLTNSRPMASKCASGLDMAGSGHGAPAMSVALRLQMPSADSSACRALHAVRDHF